MQIDITKTQTQNAKINNVSSYIINKYCKTHNLCLPDGRGKLPNVTINPFDLATKEGSYWLGYFIGDGTYVKKTMVIKSIDKSIVESFHNYCLNSNKINEVQYTTKSGKIQTIYTSYFGFEPTYNYLQSLGIPHNKTFKMKFNKELNWNIIRGLFDADGSFSKNEFKITTSNLDLLEKLKLFFEKYNFIVHISPKKGNAHDIYIRWGFKLKYTKEEILNEKKRLYNLLYCKDCVCLDRKRKLIATFIGDNN